MAGISRTRRGFLRRKVASLVAMPAPAARGQSSHGRHAKLRGRVSFPLIAAPHGRGRKGYALFVGHGRVGSLATASSRAYARMCHCLLQAFSLVNVQPYAPRFHGAPIGRQQLRCNRHRLALVVTEITPLGWPLCYVTGSPATSGLVLIGRRPRAGEGNGSRCLHRLKSRKYCYYGMVPIIDQRS
jgi:hypothetical protein